MKAILKKVEVKEYKGEKSKFKKFVFTCDVEVNSKGEIRTLKGSYNYDFAKRYFEYCGVKTKDAIGKEVSVSIGKRAFEDSEGNNRVYTYIKYMNLLDNNGEAIIMKKEDDDNSELDF